jgi:hypothetical protein
VEQGSSPLAARLERGGTARAPHPAVGRQRRSRTEGHLLLRTLSSRYRREVAEVRGRQAGEFRNDAVPSRCTEKLQALGKKVMVLIWDNASWHISKELLRRWLGKHNRRVKQTGEGVRIVSCLLPKQSPWLNSIEPKWVHAPSARWSNRTACSEHTSLPTEFAGCSTALITSISPLHRMSPDHALDVCCQDHAHNSLMWP